jgi:MFS family permease
MTKKRSVNMGWVIVGVNFITLGITYSTWYSFSLFFVALLKEFGWNRSTAAGAFSLFILMHGIEGPLVGKMADKFGPGRVFLLGSIFLGGGLALCSLIRSYLQFYLFYGLLTAIGVGATGWIPSTTIVQQWFKEKRGLPIGIISAGVGIGILLYVPSIQHLIIRIGWRMTYLVMAFSIPLVMISAAIVFLKRPPPSSSSLPTETITQAVKIDPLIIDEEWASRTWTVRGATTTKQFWFLCLLFFFANFAVQSILAHQVAFFVDEGLSALSASYLVGMIGVISIPAKILWGTLSDRIGREATYTIGTGCSILGMMFLILFATFRSPYLPYLYILSFGLGYAATASLPPLIVADFFSGKSFGTIFGTFWIPNGLGPACGAWFAGFVYDQTKSYVPVFVVMIACALFACLNLWKAAPRKIRLVPGKVGKPRSNP